MANPNKRSPFEKTLTFVKVFHDFGAIWSSPWHMNSVIIYSPEFIKKVLIEDGRKYPFRSGVW